MFTNQHVLQSPLWAKFRQSWGTKVVKAGNSQFTVHNIPLLPWKIGYMPRPNLENINWNELSVNARKEKCIFVKIEPNSNKFEKPQKLRIKKGERMFAYATFIIDLQKSEEELLSAMDIKTRYNVNLAKRKGVIVKAGHTPEMIEEFLNIYHETAKRHKIISHPDEYYRKMIEIFGTEERAEIITAYHQGIPLASMLLLFNGDTVFYPYGGSINLYRETKPFYALMWEAFRLGKLRGYKYFDMWNCLLPEDENPNHPWYGFHYFKKGFNGELVRFCGAYDLIFNPALYYIFTIASKLRFITLKSMLPVKQALNNLLFEIKKMTQLTLIFHPAKEVN